jgi:hypothetical protein
MKILKMKPFSTLKECRNIVDRPSIDEVNLCCRGSVDVSVYIDPWPVDYVWTQL